MDKRLWPLAKRIADVEHMAVQLRAIRSLGKEMVDPAGYDFVNRASNAYTAKRWIENRLEKKFPYLTGWIVDRCGTRLEDHESIIMARDRYELIWCKPLEISLSGKDLSKFDSFVPFFQEIDSDIHPVAKKLLWWRVMNVTTPPVILWGFEFEKFKECLYRAADTNAVKFKLSLKKSILVENMAEYRVFEDLLEALSKFTNINFGQDNGHLPIEPPKGGMSEKFSREFKNDYNRNYVEHLCNVLKNGRRGVTLGREILMQLDQDYLDQSTYQRLSRWVNPERPEPFAQPIAAKISVLLFGEEIERTP